MKKILVMVDAGHGVETAGKQDPSGILREYAWNRDCARVLLETLEHEPNIDGYYVVPESSETDVPLSVRAQRVNYVCKNYKDQYDAFVLISIHCNAHGDGKKYTEAHGWSIFTTRGKTASDPVATAIFDAAQKKFGKANLRYDWSDGDPDWEANFYILRETVCPAVLIEHFFMTNEEDFKYLISPQSVYDCAEVIVEGLKSYYHV